MTRISSLIAAIADAALTVAIGFAVPLAVTIASWLITGGFQSTAFEVPLTIAAAVWALGLGGAVGFTIDPQTYPGLGIAEPFTFVVSIAPLVFTAFIAWMAWRTGDRLSHEDEPWTGLAGSTVAFVLAAWLSTNFAGTDVIRIDVQGAVTVGTVTWAVMLLIGTRVWEYLPWSRWVGERIDDIADLAARAVRIAVGLVVGVFGLATAFLLIGLVTSMGRVIGLMESLQLDFAGVIGMGLLQLAYLPTLIVWATAWLMGPGIQLGEGSLATLGGTDAGPLPIVPLLGLLPEESSPYLWAALALPVTLASVIALISRSRNPGIDGRVWWERLLPPAAGALLAALALAIFAQLARGAIGPGRLLEFGPQPWWMLLAAFGIFLVGGAIGAFLPLEASESEAAPAAQSAEAAERADAAGRAGRPGESAHGEDARGTDEQDDDLDGANPRTRPHLIPFRNILGRVLGEPRDDTEDDDQDRDRDEDSAEDFDESAGVGTNESRDDREHRGEASGESDAESDHTAGWPAKPSPYARPRARLELRDAVQRPDEPDIYADIDLDEDQR
ncbi:cell division protein PerM [Gulosibacter chungangensis]|uniref:Uncharacterized protein n=1 Tax=Gulosibacter chungangensis TaxID=979746 RepID=A0A7J5BB05_9MICO|nr:DUF6350 family protein [Gulosibacter chungangensis]KAB1641642.1 hypothetical protein F8O05_11850 [Gulosibacter chungangensis]